MAEALAYFKIAGASATIAKGLWDIGAALKDAGTQVRQLATSVECTSSVLMQLGQVLDADGAGVHIDDKRLAARHLEQCSHLMDKLQTVLVKLRRLINEKGKIHLWSRVRFVFDRSGLTQKWQTLESLKSSLTLLVSVMNLRSAAKKDSSSETTILLQRLLEQGVEDYAARTRQNRQLLLDSGAEALLEAGDEDEDERSRRNGVSNNLHRASLGTDGDASDRDTDVISVSETIDLTGADDITSVVLRDTNLSGMARQAQETELFNDDENFEHQRIWDIIQALHSETGVLARDVLRMAQNGGLVPGPKIAWICTNTAGYRAANALLDQKTMRRVPRREGDVTHTTGSVGSALVIVIYFPPVIPGKGEETTTGEFDIQTSDDVLRRHLAGVELVVMISEVIPEGELKGFRAGDVIIGRDLIVDQVVTAFPYSPELSFPMSISEGVLEVILQLSLGEMDDSAAQAKLKSIGPGIFERRTAGVNRNETVGSVRMHSAPIALTEHHDNEGFPGFFLSEGYLSISRDLAVLAAEHPILVVCGVPPRKTRAIGTAVNERDEFAIGQATIAAKLLMTLLWG